MWDDSLLSHSSVVGWAKEDFVGISSKIYHLLNWSFPRWNASVSSTQTNIFETFYWTTKSNECCDTVETFSWFHARTLVRTNSMPFTGSSDSPGHLVRNWSWCKFLPVRESTYFLMCHANIGIVPWGRLRQGRQIALNVVRGPVRAAGLSLLHILELVPLIQLLISHCPPVQLCQIALYCFALQLGNWFGRVLAIIYLNILFPGRFSLKTNINHFQFSYWFSPWNFQL